MSVVYWLNATACWAPYLESAKKVMVPFFTIYFVIFSAYFKLPEKTTNYDCYVDYLYKVVRSCGETGNQTTVSSNIVGFSPQEESGRERQWTSFHDFIIICTVHYKTTLLQSQDVSMTWMVRWFACFLFLKKGNLTIKFNPIYFSNPKYISYFINNSNDERILLLFCTCLLWNCDYQYGTTFGTFLSAILPGDALLKTLPR